MGDWETGKGTFVKYADGEFNDIREIKLGVIYLQFLIVNFLSRRNILLALAVNL